MIKVCPDCLCEMFNVYDDNYVCINCESEHKESELYTIPDEITEESLKIGLNSGIIRLTYNERNTYGVACEIGNSLFYFDGPDADRAESVEDYLKKYCPPENLPELLYSCIGTAENAVANGIPRYEWVYYAYVLTESLKGDAV